MRRAGRILILLAILVLVVGMTVFERLWVRGWTHPLDVAIYPVAMDAGSEAFVRQLQPADFDEIADFLAGEAHNHWKKSIPTPRLRLEAPVADRPPPVQARTGLEAIRSSLQLRYYAFRRTSFWQSLGAIRLFVLYHEPRADAVLPHSLALAKGLLGVVQVFASSAQRAQNNVVIAHELLHTLGATDKYDANGQPRYPEGYADPYLTPRLPQYQAEIMAGRVPVTEGRAEIPTSLADIVIGYQTAAEINW